MTLNGGLSISTSPYSTLAFDDQADNMISRSGSFHLSRHVRKFTGAGTDDLIQKILNLVEERMTIDQVQRYQRSGKHARNLIKVLTKDQIVTLMPNLSVNECALVVERIPARRIVQFREHTIAFTTMITHIDSDRAMRVFERISDADVIAFVTESIQSHPSQSALKSLSLLLESLPAKRFDKLCRQMTAQQKAAIVLLIIEKSLLEIMITHLDFPAQGNVVQSMNITQIEMALNCVPMDKALDFTLAIPHEVWDRIAIPNQVDGSVSLLSLIKLLREPPDIMPQFFYAQMTLMQLRYVIIFDERKDQFKAIVSKIETHRLIRLMEEIDIQRRKKVVSIVARESMCMIVPLLSRNVLKSCASSLAKRMTMVQFKALCIEQYCILVPKLKEPHVKEMIEPLTKMQNPEDISCIDPSVVGIASFHYNTFFTQHSRRLSPVQLERSVPLMDLSLLGEVFSGLRPHAQETIRSRIYLNCNYLKMNPEKVFQQYEEMHVASVNKNPRKYRNINSLLTKKLDSIRVLLSPFFSDIPPLKQDSSKTPGELYRLAVKYSNELDSARDSSLTDGSDNRTFSRSDRSDASDGDTTTSGERCDDNE